MKFTVSQSSLTQAIGVVMKGVASASTLPILSGVLVKAQDGILEFQTSNYTISIRHRIAAHVEEEGEMVIPCKMLSNITKTLPDAPVTFELSERQVLISCEKSSFRLNTLDANDFPEFPAYAIESAVELPTDILSEMVGRVWRVTSTDKARPILGGVHMRSRTTPCAWWRPIPSAWPCAIRRSRPRPSRAPLSSTFRLTPLTTH